MDGNNEGAGFTMGGSGGLAEALGASKAPKFNLMEALKGAKGPKMPKSGGSAPVGMGKGEPHMPEGIRGRE